MKKLISLFFVFLFSATLIQCGSQTNNDDQWSLYDENTGLWSIQLGKIDAGTTEVHIPLGVFGDGSASLTNASFGFAVNDQSRFYSLDPSAYFVPEPELVAFNVPVVETGDTIAFTINKQDGGSVTYEGTLSDTDDTFATLTGAALDTALCTTKEALLGAWTLPGFTDSDGAVYGDSTYAFGLYNTLYFRAEEQTTGMILEVKGTYQLMSTNTMTWTWTAYASLDGQTQSSDTVTETVQLDFSGETLTLTYEDGSQETLNDRSTYSSYLDETSITSNLYRYDGKCSVADYTVEVDWSGSGATLGSDIENYWWFALPINDLYTAAEFATTEFITFNPDDTAPETGLFALGVVVFEDDAWSTTSLVGTFSLNEDEQQLTLTFDDTTNSNAEALMTYDYKYVAPYLLLTPASGDELLLSNEVFEVAVTPI